ncbi:hypothetical protein AB4Y40_33930 [Paraburkholderia sp. EG287B]|uniref:hypothetical protein n=1 Tax=Paraburkholderia sp. EG287B TaxID=3237010 RepID=UPI0034D349FA
MMRRNDDDSPRDIFDPKDELSDRSRLTIAKCELAGLSDQGISHLVSKVCGFILIGPALSFRVAARVVDSPLQIEFGDAKRCKAPRKG